MAYGDESQIGSIVHALLRNAAEALANSVIHVEVDPELFDDDSPLPLEAAEYIIVTIHDQGTGSSNDFSDRIFEPFFITKDGGEGLGLTKAFSIAQQH
jgi:nitrogen-specific signal transduction histidine kinase